MFINYNRYIKDTNVTYQLHIPEQLTKDITKHLSKLMLPITSTNIHKTLSDELKTLTLQLAGSR